MKTFLGKYFQKRYDELVGRSQAAYDGPVLEIRQMLEDLVSFDDRDWCVYAFSRERLRDLIDVEERQRLSGGAMACGREYARRMKREYEGDLKRMVTEFGLDVTYPYNPDRFRKGQAARFAGFEKPNKITIYSDCVQQAEELYEKEGLRSVLGSINFHDALLAHELFHYLEEIHQGEIYTRQTKVRVTRTNLIRRESTVSVLSEIAGMAFASELLELPYCLYVLDCLFSYMYSPKSASDLYRMTLRIVKKSPGCGRE